MNEGDICFLDKLVWHQANPITAGERWVLVIFYRTFRVDADGNPVQLPCIAARGAKAARVDATDPPQSTSAGAAAQKDPAGFHLRRYELDVLRPLSPHL